MDVSPNRFIALKCNRGLKNPEARRGRPFMALRQRVRNGLATNASPE
jgi:hypothetical protein